MRNYYRCSVTAAVAMSCSSQDSRNIHLHVVLDLLQVIVTQTALSLSIRFNAAVLLLDHLQSSCHVFFPTHEVSKRVSL